MLKKLIALTCLTLSISANSATLIVNDGMLMGATGVDVEGTLYDVSFLDGSCNSLFSGCTSFAFTTETAALLASQALLDQVFVDIFDREPVLTNGIPDRDGLSQAWFFTPYFSSNPCTQCTRIVFVTSAVNTASSAALDDWVSPRFIITDDTWTSVFRKCFECGNAFVGWKISPVPIPAAAWLFGSALLGLGAIKRTNKT